MTKTTTASDCAGANSGQPTLTVQDFADTFGTTVQELPAECQDLIRRHDFRYTPLTGENRDSVLLDVLKRIDSGSFTVAGKEGKARWEKGWAENLDGFVARGGDVSELVPKYIRPRQPLRFRQNYILPIDPNFELNWYAIFRKWFFNAYLRDAPTILEFGCGSGFNLAELADAYPEKEYFGLDWAAPSRDIVNALAKKFGWNMKGLLFDFFEPDRSVSIPNGAVIFTIGALEQTGRNYERFLQFLLNAAPRLCLHIEPILEWYDPNNLVDYAAIRFHKARNYWQGFPARLRELANQGRIEILKEHRSNFGSVHLEGYSQLFWRPIQK